MIWPNFGTGSPMFSPLFDYVTRDEGEVNIFGVCIVLMNTFCNVIRYSEIG
jgi:hypothetical protein